jgi:hypothetical protein
VTRYLEGYKDQWQTAEIPDSGTTIEFTVKKI